MITTLRRGVATGALGGAIAGPLAVLTFLGMAIAMATPARSAPDFEAVTRGIGGVLTFITLAVFLGALAGVVPGALVGLAIGVLGDRAGRRPRIVVATLSGIAVLVLGVGFMALRMDLTWASWLTVPPLPVAVAVGAWRGRYVVHGRPRT